MSDSPLFVLLLFGLSILFASALTLGYKARYAGWLCWFFWVSLHHRNPMVLNQGDHYLALLLFWGGFLPWSETLSLDAVQKECPPSSWSVRSLAGSCYLIQICLVYWFSAVLRTGPEWQVEGSALYYALSMEPLRTSFATTMLSLGAMPLAFFSLASLYMEEAGPILLLLPSSRLRLLGVFLIVSFHFGILLTLSIGVFSLIAMAAPLGLLPAIFWESRPGQWLFTRLKDCYAALFALLPRTQGTVPRGTENPYLRPALNRIVPTLALCLTIFHLAWGIYRPDDKTLLSNLARVVSLDQRWGVFSPSPHRNSGWDAVPAFTESGEQTDLITGEPYKFPTERTAAGISLADARWQTYRSKFSTISERHAEAYLQYLVKQWDEDHPANQVVSAQYLFYHRPTLPDYLLGEEGVRAGPVYHR